jgi:hypothetical protein
VASRLKMPRFQRFNKSIPLMGVQASQSLCRVEG